MVDEKPILLLTEEGVSKVEKLLNIDNLYDEKTWNYHIILTRR